jgi:arabinose-5-phosphate isomerase
MMPKPEPSSLTPTHDPDSQFQSMAIAVLRTEACAIHDLVPRIDASFSRACTILLGNRGHVVVMGIGKSGHVARKIAATFSSTGTPAFFLHPAEAGHGDAGMITQQDIALAISNSGETQEIIALLPVIKRLGIPMVTIVGRTPSTLARAADVALDASVTREACPLGLAPTASSTAALAMGDALAIALLSARGFTEADFALSHPLGTLGRRLLLRIGDLMHHHDAIPRVRPDTTLAEAILEITKKGLGITAVVDEHDHLLGVFTDGDLRRCLEDTLDWRTTPIASVMTREAKIATPDMLAAEALRLMETFLISALIVVDESGTVVGVLHTHDLLRAGIA